MTTATHSNLVSSIFVHRDIDGAGLRRRRAKLLRSLVGLGICCGIALGGSDWTQGREPNEPQTQTVPVRRSLSAQRGTYEPPKLVRPALGKAVSGRPAAAPSSNALAGVPQPPEQDAIEPSAEKLEPVPVVLQPAILAAEDLDGAYFSEVSEAERRERPVLLPVGFEAANEPTGLESVEVDVVQSSEDAPLNKPKSAHSLSVHDEFEHDYEGEPTIALQGHWQSMGHYCDAPGPGCGCEPSIIDTSCDAVGLAPSCAGGCDACGTCTECLGVWHGLRWPRASRWFGNAEYLLWSRRGNDLPTLAQANPGTVGATSLFGGNGRIGESSESGGRFTLGTWLDTCQSHSLVGRFWGVGREEESFFVDGTFGQAVGIPFEQAVPPLGTFYDIISSPADPGEFLAIDLKTEVYGADAAIRRRWVEGLGGRIDFLWGYQFMRVNESLGISGSGTNVLGQVRNVTESFDIDNEFHGGQLGLALHYEECGWTFDGLFKVGLGGLSRRAALRAQSNIGAGDEGYFVYPSNSGISNDTEFAVMPEISLGLGYALNSNVDFTVGYSYLMLSDVIQIDGMIDTTIDTAAVPTTGRPSRNFRSNDYWLHGVHFGVAINY